MDEPDKIAESFDKLNCLFKDYQNSISDEVKDFIKTEFQKTCIAAIDAHVEFLKQVEEDKKKIESSKKSLEKTIELMKMQLPNYSDEEFNKILASLGMPPMLQEVQASMGGIPCHPVVDDPSIKKVAKQYADLMKSDEIADEVSTTDTVQPGIIETSSGAVLSILPQKSKVKKTKKSKTSKKAAKK